jgi:hypothetical protein
LEGQLHRVDVTVLPVFLRPASEIAGNWSVTLSPDGRHAAYVSDRGGTPAVWVQPIGSELAFQIAFPEPVDLVVIEATDEAHAVVTAASGRRYGTGDGGKTWTSR